MAHFARLDENNIVLAVHVVNNEVLDPNNEEQSGIDFLTELHKHNNWKQTSYNDTFRYNFASIDYTYDPIDDAFIAPMPECGHEELTLNQTNFRWECSNEEHETLAK